MIGDWYCRDEETFVIFSALENINKWIAKYFRTVLRADVMFCVLKRTFITLLIKRP